MHKAQVKFGAYLISAGLQHKRLNSFSDVASNIRIALAAIFGDMARPILCWYHLNLHCHQYLSMGIKGDKRSRQDIRNEHNSRLGAGNVDEAVAYLNQLKPKLIKKRARIEELIQYLNRKKPYTTCYALRKMACYKNSSNAAEKTNDPVVAHRLEITNYWDVFSEH